MSNLKNDVKNIQIIKNNYVKTKIINQSKSLFNEIIKKEIGNNEIKYCVKSKLNNKNKKNKLNNNIFPIIFIFLLLIILSKEIKITNINLFSEINITIKGSMNQNILNNNNFMFTPLPTQILINDEIQNYIDKIVYNLTEEINNITMRWESQITTCKYMFYGLSNITNIDLSNFDISEVTEMKYMFYGCKSLISLDLSVFKNTSSLKDMSNMFYQCNSLKHINFTNFNTSNDLKMDYLFYNCNSLTSLDLSYFDASLVNNMANFS